MYTPPRKVQIDAELFVDLYVFVKDVAEDRIGDLLDAEIEAAELLPKLQTKLDAMVARKEYAERIEKEKESR